MLHFRQIHEGQAGLIAIQIPTFILMKPGFTTIVLADRQHARLPLRDSVAWSSLGRIQSSSGSRPELVTESSERASLSGSPFVDAKCSTRKLKELGAT